MPRWLFRARLSTVADAEGPEAIARWLREKAGRPIRYEKVKPGDEQILPPREQRELDALPSWLDRKREA
jgi:hypothetical protein